MKVEHIVWEDWNWIDQAAAGILELKIYWHGGGADTVVMEGTYNNNGRGSFTNQFVTIDENTQGVSGISLCRVGTIAE